MLPQFFEHPQFLFGMPGGTELVLILLIVILFFGGKKIPGLMRGLGKSVKEFNDAKNAGKKQIEEEKNPGKINASTPKEMVADKTTSN